MTSSRFPLALALLALVLPACGGGGAAGAVPGAAAVGSLTIASDATRDGYLGFISASASRVRNLVNGIHAGDQDQYAARRSVRGFVSFDLRGLPPGARITSATLRVFQTAIVGSPYAKLGSIRADHVDYGNTLDYDEFGLPFLGASTAGTLSSTRTLGWKQLDVTERVLADVAEGRIRSQYRLRYGIRYSADAVNDVAVFEDGDMSQGTVNPPLLEVVYTLP